jgi:hypothetical protein
MNVGCAETLHEYGGDALWMTLKGSFRRSLKRQSVHIRWSRT